MSVLILGLAESLLHGSLSSADGAGGGILGGVNDTAGDAELKSCPPTSGGSEGGDLILDGFKRVPLAPALQFPLDVPQRVTDEIRHI